MSAAIKMHSAQVSTLPPRGGSFSMQAEIGGNSTLNQAIAAKPQKKQYCRLMRPPRLNGIAMVTQLLYRYKDKPASWLFVMGTLLGGAYEYLCSVFTEERADEEQ